MIYAIPVAILLACIFIYLGAAEEIIKNLKEHNAQETQD